MVGTNDKQNELVFYFEEQHPAARLRVRLHRTLLVPNNGRLHAPPPSQGILSIRHVTDFAPRVPKHWLLRKGVFAPIYPEKESIYLEFLTTLTPEGPPYPFAVAVAAGLINALTGEPWTEELQSGGYLVVPPTNRLDGFKPASGATEVRQFLPVLLGSGETMEEQQSGQARFGGIQLGVAPLRGFEFRRQIRDSRGASGGVRWAQSLSATVGLGPGGRVRQSIPPDPIRPRHWAEPERCFIHLCHAVAWRVITDELPHACS